MGTAAGNEEGQHEDDNNKQDNNNEGEKTKSLPHMLKKRLNNM